MHSRLNAARSSRWLALLLTLAGEVSFAPTAARAFTETNNYPKPEWISAAEARPNQRVTFRHTFTNAPGNLKAILLVAGDGKISVELNGQPVADAEGRERAAGFDVTPHVRAGENSVRVLQQSDRSGAQLGFVLELSSPQGRIHWIVSDTNWLTSADGKNWVRVASHGRTSADAAADPFDPKRAFDAYNSWQLAKGANAATPAESLTLPPGFKAELLRSAQPDEDSWIALAFDPQGRLTIAKEKRGLLCFTLGAAATTISKIETINDTLLECRGLLYAHGSLYASANGSHGLVRLRDSKHDGVFDDARELLHTDGGTGHGRNHVKLGPDGKIYLIHGDDVTLTPKASSHCPPNFFGPDQLIPAAWDESPARLAQRLPLGHLLRADADGANWEMLCGGLRNPLDVAFNEDGEAFTYDADNERDIGAPWYKPTRVLHLVSGGDYGWRRSTATFPEFRPDCLPPVVNIGVGSPTGIEFGTRAKFPDRWRRALFISDWAYGRILAVHMKPAGASYTGTSETFVSGRPLNVTDLAFGPDGAMYFVTGGRRTQSGLYRVSFTGPKEMKPEKNSAKLAEENKCAELRKLRRNLEGLHRPPITPMSSSQIISNLWPHLYHPDPWIRHAARVAWEWQPVDAWSGKLGSLSTNSPYPPLTGLLAAARFGAGARKVSWESWKFDVFAKYDYVIHSLAVTSLPLAAQSREEQLTSLRSYAIRLIHHPLHHLNQRIDMLDLFEPCFPSDDFALNHELVELLVFLKSPHVLAKTLPLMAKAGTSEELLRYLYCLRAVKDGWTPEAQRAFLAALARAEAMQGAREYYRALEKIRAEFTASLSTSERLALRSLLEKKSAPPLAVTAVTRFVQEWKLADLEPHLDRVAHGRDFAQGRGAFAAAQCAACHRVGSDGGVLGPDLTAIASRFGRRDMLIHILAPSLAIDDKFRQTTFVLKDGDAVTGTVEVEDGEKILVRQNLLSEETTTVRPGDIRERRVSDISPMPEGLLNGLTREQILDLLAFLESGGSEKHAAFKR